MLPQRPYPDGFMNPPSGAVAGPMGYLAPNMGAAMQLGIGGTPSMNPMRVTAPAGDVVAAPHQATATARTYSAPIDAVARQQTDVALPFGVSYAAVGGTPAFAYQMDAIKSDSMAGRAPMGMGGAGVMGGMGGAGGFHPLGNGPAAALALKTRPLGNTPFVNPSGAKDLSGTDSNDPTIARRPDTFTEADWAKLSQDQRQKLLDANNAATLLAVSNGLKTGLDATSAIIQSVINSNDAAARNTLNLEIEKLKNNAAIQLAQINAKKETDLATINAQVQQAVSNGQITAQQAFDLMKQAQQIQQGEQGFFDTTAGKVTIGVGVLAVAGGAYWLATRNDGARRNPEVTHSREAVEYSHTDYFSRGGSRSGSKKRRARR